MMRLLDLYRHTDPALARASRSAWAWRRSRAFRPSPTRSRSPARPVRVRRCAPISRRIRGRHGKFLAPDGPHRSARLRRLGHHADEGAINNDKLAAPGRSMVRWPRSRPWVRPGARTTVVVVVTEFLAAPPASTAPKAPITAPPRSRSSGAAPLKVAAWSRIGRASSRSNCRTTATSLPPTCAPW